MAALLVNSKKIIVPAMCGMIYGQLLFEIFNLAGGYRLGLGLGLGFFGSELHDVRTWVI